MAPRVCSTTEDLARSTAPRKAAIGRAFVALFKVRVVMLLLLAAVGGAFLAAGGWPGWGTLALLLVTGWMAAAGASAINEYLERELDARMERTRYRRPLVNGAVSTFRWVPYAGTAMIVAPVLAVLPFNPALSLFLALGAAIYIVVYTIWLKPRTPLNIVIGGAAGSAAVLSGSAAAGLWNEPGALLLALLVLLWTPIHFWSLAIAYRDDYARGGFPMLPVHTTPRTAAGWILLHTGGTALATIALASHPALGWPFAIPAGLGLLALVVLNVRLLAQPVRARALALFHTSNLYLAVVLCAICLNTVIG